MFSKGMLFKMNLCFIIVSILQIDRVVTQLYPSFLKSILNLLNEGGQQDINEPRDEPFIYNEYDFIVVGAGTAGCVVANRLSENPNWTVLLIEAGEQENFAMDIPAMANFFQFTYSNWKYKTQPSNSFCLAMNNHQCNWPRGKVMGGSSVLNYMVYTRGNRRDYDYWASIGNTGWSYKDVLPYFKKIEDFRVSNLYNEKYHKRGGYLSVEQPSWRTPLAEAFVIGGQQTGLPYVDYNGATQTGIAYLQASLNNGTRASASRSYLHPIRNRKNLHVKKLSLVTKILIDPTTKRAYGVEFIRNRQKYTIRAKREVIVSGGAINSPQLLMLSGIGPKKHLQKVNVPVIQNLKVGYNLQDHIAVGGLTFIANDTVSLITDRILGNTKYLTDYFSFHQGPLSIPGGLEAIAFYDLKNPNSTDGYPDLEIFYSGGSISSEPSLRINFGLTQQIYNDIFKPIEGIDSMSSYPMLLQPKSKGRIMLANNKPFTKPLIYPNYLAYQEDLDTLIEGIKKMIEITNTPAFKKFDTRIHDIPIPACRHLTFGSDKYWECHIRHFTFTIYHYSGTCKMGPVSDTTAVVDPRLRVIGIRGLRVIDASIMPKIPAAHTNSPTYMIAEKGADMIKQDWNYPTEQIS